MMRAPFCIHQEGISFFYPWPHEWPPFPPIGKPCRFEFSAVRIKGFLFLRKRRIDETLYDDPDLHGIATPAAG